MKKRLYFAFLCLASFGYAQFSTGSTPISLTDGFTVKFDTNTTTVTMTLNGPDNVWFALGLGMTRMSQIGDGVVVTGGATSALTDRRFSGGFSAPASDAIQNWTTVSNVDNGATRTVVATRALSTGDTAGSDFTFTNGTGSVNLIWAIGTSATLISHASRGSGIVGNFALSTDSFASAGFKMYPNPANDIIAIELPNQLETVNVTIFDLLGKEVFSKEISKLENKLNTSSMQVGNYIVKVSSDGKSHFTNLIIE